MGISNWRFETRTERMVGLYRLPPNVVVVSSSGSSSNSFFFSSSPFPSDDEEERDSVEAFEPSIFSTMVIVVSADMVKFPIALFRVFPVCRVLFQFCPGSVRAEEYPVVLYVCNWRAPSSQVTFVNI